MKHQRPGTGGSVRDGLKLHRHTVRWSGRAHTVITLRPGTRARFSTNRFHETWHVLSDDHGARLLARLLWGLAYQGRPGTVVLIDRPFLSPNPFDADPADPIVLVPGWCTPFDDYAARQLRRRLPLSRSEGTVRWHTFGLDRTLEPGASEIWWKQRRYRDGEGDIARRHGLLVVQPRTPDDARAWALLAAELDTTRFGTDYTYLDPWDQGHDGEIQIFRRFRPMVGVARRARTQVLSRPGAPTDPDALRASVWSEAEQVRGDAHLRVRQWQGRGWGLGDAAAAMLAPAGVTTVDELADVGPVEAYRRMRAAEVKGLGLDMLWAMDAALTYRDRSAVDAERRRELLSELGPPPPSRPPRRRRYRAPIRRTPAYDRT
ncbi:TfoX/Sxy family DNA transformation protein [Nocardia spumae]|uniref:TfoX/Sxy family DNA transformation protein n=1 Tax=Nocardia spumae TaxID=2887190 RepID=UPI001D15C307|nr:TfoX/Sxy family DNA transformation protein [Nocardia spumae]